MKKILYVWILFCTTTLYPFTEDNINNLPIESHSDNQLKNESQNEFYDETDLDQQMLFGKYDESEFTTGITQKPSYIKETLYRFGIIIFLKYIQIHSFFENKITQVKKVFWHIRTYM